MGGDEVGCAGEICRIDAPLGLAAHEPADDVGEDVGDVRVGELGFLTRTLAREPGVGIGRGLMGVVPSRRPVKIDGVIARIVRRRAGPASFRRQLLRLATASSTVRALPSSGSCAR